MAAQVDAEMLVKGIASTQRVCLSTMVNRYENPSEGGSGPTMSTWSDEKRASGIGRWTKGVLVWRVILEEMQAWQSRTRWRISDRIPGQTKRDEI